MKKHIFVSTLIAATAMAVPAFADTLTWTGSTDSSWTGSNWSEGTWTDNSDALFTTTGAGTVNVTTDVTAGSVTIDSGASYTFNIGSGATLTTGALTTNGSLAFSGAGTFAFNGASAGTTFTFSGSDFTGTLEVVNGTLDTTKVTLTSSMTVVMDANGEITTGGYFDVNATNAILSNTADTTFAANLEISGTSGGGVIIRAGEHTTTFTGTVTGIEGTTLQLNGGGAAIFTNTVTLAGTYRNYQGTTTFQNETTLGTLDILQDGSNSSAVIFSGSSAQATVGTLSVDTSSGAGTDSLQVVNGASLTVGAISLAHDINVTTDSSSTFTVTGDVTSSGGNLILGEGSTVTATGATADGVAALQGIAGEGTLSIEGTAIGTIFTVTTDSSFTGTVDVQKGYLRLEGTSIASTASLVLQASGSQTSIGIYTDGTDSNTLASIQYGANGQESLAVELANDITLEGTGGVIIRSVSSAYTGTFSGNISAADTDAAYLQLNGGGSAIFTGDITLTSGGYINYQGSTTFTGEVLLGSLAIYQPDANANTVTFTGEEAAADIGTLTIHASEGSVAANLAVTDDAVVRVADLVINHDVDITIDGGMLYINDSVTGSSSVSVTISGGGTLLLGDDVTLNAATISIVLGTDNMDEDYALIGGTVTSTAAIAITVDSAVAGILAEEGEYTFNIYSEDLGFEESAFDLSALDPYGTVTWNGDGTITIAVGAVPEPSMFGLFFGLGAIGLVATRRRKRA